MNLRSSGRQPEDRGICHAIGLEPGSLTRTVLTAQYLVTSIMSDPGTQCILRLVDKKRGMAS